MNSTLTQPAENANYTEYYTAQEANFSSTTSQTQSTDASATLSINLTTSVASIVSSEPFNSTSENSSVILSYVTNSASIMG